MELFPLTQPPKHAGLNSSNNSQQPITNNNNQSPITMNPFFAEFFGTAIIIVFGGGVVSNVLLTKTKGNNSGWIVITFGWAVGVFTGVLISAPFSGAHLNPAVTLALGPCT